MSNKNYSLEIISHHPTFKNKSLRKYYVDGIDTIGAWGDEPFEIKFTNHTWQKVQVKLSVDGTDVLSGELASTDVTKDMWMVNGYGTLSLKAWPETDNGGAQLIFTSGSNSVAVHTHGDLSNRGIIAAAVYTEGHVEPIRYTPIVIQNHSYPIRRRSILDHDYYFTNNTSGGTLGGATFGSNTIGTPKGAAASDTFTLSDCSFNADVGAASASASMDSLGLSDSRGETKSLESLVAVGAGQHVDQKLTHVAGLIKPVFTESVRVKYMWWDELVSKLRAHNVPMPHPSGFPGDVKKTNISLGGTPRIGDFLGAAFPREKPKEQRVESYPSYLRV